MPRNETARPGKRPLRSLSAQEKMEAIRRVHDGESKAAVARDIGVPESTLRGWCKSEHKIKNQVRNLNCFEQPESSSRSCSDRSNSGSPQCGANLTLNAVCSTPRDTSNEELESSSKRLRLDNGHAVGTSSLPYNGDINGQLLTPSNQYNLASTSDPKVLTAMHELACMQKNKFLCQLFAPQTSASTSNLGALSVLNAFNASNALNENGLQYHNRNNGTIGNKRRHSALQQDAQGSAAFRNFPKTPSVMELPGTPSTSSGLVNGIQAESTQPDSPSKNDTKRTVERVAIMLSLQHYIQQQQAMQQQQQQQHQQQQQPQQLNVTDNNLDIMKTYINLYSQIKYAAQLDSLNSNNNNVQQNGNEEGNSTIQRLTEAIYHVEWLLNWLNTEKTLTSRITFSQIQSIIKIQDCFKKWKSELEKNSRETPRS